MSYHGVPARHGNAYRIGRPDGNDNGSLVQRDCIKSVMSVE